MGRRKDQAQFNMRLSKPLLKRLQIAAKDQDRSVNSEMVHRLERSFQANATQLNEMAQAFLDLAADKLASEKPSFLGTLFSRVSGEPSDLAPPALRRSPPRRSGPEPDDETDEQRKARLRATAEGYRRNAKRHDARGKHDSAARAREMADELERDARALTQGQAPQQPRSAPGQESELPIRRPAPAGDRPLSDAERRLIIRAEELAAQGRTKDAATVRFMLGRPLPRPLPQYLVDLLGQELLDLLDQPELPMPQPRGRQAK